MRKFRFVAFAFMALLILVIPAASAELKIAYADLQRALNQCDAGVKAKEDLKKEAMELEKELDVEQEELKKFKEEIDKKRSVWNAETLKAKEEEFKTRSQEFQTKFMEYNDRLNERKLDKEAEIIKELRDAVVEIADRDGYTYVFEISVGGIIHAPEDADITEEVIKIHNEKTKKKTR
ncbi:MAG TPA: OmpH family outer membrane protein [Thermodesulfobacteriota bacterium]|nr:OmpH family outer membrane protein [Thermodesulfobacteriota bacterium]